MESTLKTHLLHILEDLIQEEWEKFKSQLTDITLAKGYQHIPRSALQLATPVTLADKLIQYYGEEYCITVTKNVLIAINQRNLAGKFCQLVEKSGSSTEKGGKQKNKRKQENEAVRNGDKGQLNFPKRIKTIFNPKKTSSNESVPDSRDPQPSNNKELTTKNQHFADLIRRLNLKNYYPNKMTKVDTFLINKTSLHGTQPKAEGELPLCFLEKLLALDYHFRYLVYRGNTETISTESQVLRTTEIGRTPENFFIIKETQSAAVQTCIHPMDIQMAIFHCADNFTRQYILNKLSICQFALPLLVPNPSSSTIEFPLWPLTQIRKTWREVEKIGWEKKIRNYNNQLISCQPTHIVSFIRVGNYVSTSKSQILNLLLSKGKHDHFPHHHPRKDNNQCLLIDGMVEICWFCPGGRAGDRFENCIAFTNLHGNAEVHEKQVKFLQEVSSVTVILLSTSFDKVKTLLHQLLESPKPLICLFENEEHIMDENPAHKVRIGIKNLNKIEIADKITAALKKLLKNAGSPCSLSNWANIARKYELTIDKDQGNCQEAGEKADILLNILRKVKLSEIKEKLLPLQGGLWHDWCKKDKEFHYLRKKGNISIKQYKDEIEKEKQKIRCEQYEKAIILNDLMKTLLESLQSHLETHTELYFLQGLSMLIDQLTTKDLEVLHLKYRSLLAQVQAEKPKLLRRDSLKRWEAELQIISKEIRSSTLGVEHLLREVGQIYEALEGASVKINTLYLSLPQMVADLMIAGAPIELMDGDAAYVPLKWVTAVFNKVSEKVGNRRVFVLSVLGPQSSGKSTLLNAMFGLQLSLSAGRCTRGAYMQLLKVDEKFREEAGFDFVLVVDTDGLRASEIGHKAQNEDNELATFVIGLGNLTLINVWGKDLSDIQDILQIAVHAFLRMKQHNISPSCLFVHQNTEEIVDTNQSMEWRTGLQERLDEMTLTAAKHEQCPDVCHFSDVIHFDKNHIHCFAHLWEGYPPMAPPNPCYSHSVQELKKRILKHAEEPRTRILKITELQVRIRELWQALVKENFIFRFRNTQEIMAMNELETKYVSWTWKLRSHVLKLQNDLTNQIQRGAVEVIKRSSFENQIVQEYETIKQELEKYFREDKERDILLQWKGKFEKDLKKLQEDLVVETLRKCEDQIRGKKIRDLLEEQKVKFEYKLLEKVREMTETLQRTELHEKELRDIFNQVWSESISIPLSPTIPPAEGPDIDIDLENILLEHFKQHPNIVNKIMFRDKKKKFSLDYSKHVISCPELGPLQMSGLSMEELEKDIKQIIAQIMTSVKKQIHNREQQNEGYSSSYFHEILHVIHTDAKAACQGGRFMLTNRCKLELALELFQEAAERFKKMCIEFRSRNNPTMYLESQKEEFYKNYQNIDFFGAKNFVSLMNLHKN